MNDNILPMLGVVTEIRVDTPDIKTFRVEALEGGKCFEHMPGQCAMLSIPGGRGHVSSLADGEGVSEFSIKKCGCLTSWLHQMDVGQQITIRGPYGKPFPVDDELKGKDLLFIAGGVGLAPLHSVINYVLDKRDSYGKVDVVYGSRSKEDLLDLEEIQTRWMDPKNDIDVHLTIDWQRQEGWDGHVAFVPTYVKELGFDPGQSGDADVAPPIAIKLCFRR